MPEQPRLRILVVQSSLENIMSAVLILAFLVGWTSG